MGSYMRGRFPDGRTFLIRTQHFMATAFHSNNCITYTLPLYFPVLLLATWEPCPETKGFPDGSVIPDTRFLNPCIRVALSYLITRGPYRRTQQKGLLESRSRGRVRKSPTVQKSPSLPNCPKTITMVIFNQKTVTVNWPWRGYQSQLERWPSSEEQRERYVCLCFSPES